MMAQQQTDNLIHFNGLMIRLCFNTLYELTVVLRWLKSLHDSGKTAAEQGGREMVGRAKSLFDYIAQGQNDMSSYFSFLLRTCPVMVATEGPLFHQFQRLMYGKLNVATFAVPRSLSRTGHYWRVCDLLEFMQFMQIPTGPGKSRDELIAQIVRAKTDFDN